MAIHGIKKEEKQQFKKELFTGLTGVRVVAVNPTRKALNKLLSVEDSDNDQEIKYISVNSDQQEVVRLSFWLHDDFNDKYFCHTINITNKVRESMNKDKAQIINCVGSTTWVPYKVPAEERKQTYDYEFVEDLDETVIPKWFTSFTDKEGKVIGEKTWKKAAKGEEELALFLKAWLAGDDGIDLYKPGADLTVDLNRLLRGNFSELQGLVGSGLSSPFIVLTGVATDQNDPSKKYQRVYGKGFLPINFMKYVNNNMSFAKGYAEKVWKKFESDVTGSYGWDIYFKLSKLTPYDEKEDVAAEKEVDRTSSDY